MEWNDYKSCKNYPLKDYLYCYLNVRVATAPGEFGSSFLVAPSQERSDLSGQYSDHRLVGWLSMESYEKNFNFQNFTRFHILCRFGLIHFWTPSSLYLERLFISSYSSPYCFISLYLLYILFILSHHLPTKSIVTVELNHIIRWRVTQCWWVFLFQTGKTWNLPKTIQLYFYTGNLHPSQEKCLQK